MAEYKDCSACSTDPKIEHMAWTRRREFLFDALRTGVTIGTSALLGFQVADLFRPTRRGSMNSFVLKRTVSFPAGLTYEQAALESRSWLRRERIETLDQHFQSTGRLQSVSTVKGSSSYSVERVFASLEDLVAWETALASLRVHNSERLAGSGFKFERSVAPYRSIV